MWTEQYTVADVDRTKCATYRYGSRCVWYWAMCCGKSYGCHLYGMKNSKACVLDIDMELPSVMSCKVLCRYVDTICGVWYLSILCIFYIVIINNSHVPNPWHKLRTYLLHGAVLLEKLTGFQLLKKLPAFYKSRRFITAFISLHDTTANTNENWTVYHKADTQLFWVLI
jgi:hypothetical protein